MWNLFELIKEFVESRKRQSEERESKTRLAARGRLSIEALEDRCMLALSVGGDVQVTDIYNYSEPAGTMPVQAAEVQLFLGTADDVAAGTATLLGTTYTDDDGHYALVGIAGDRAPGEVITVAAATRSRRMTDGDLTSDAYYTVFVDGPGSPAEASPRRVVLRQLEME